MFFVPLPGEVFTCCAAHKEGVGQIDIAAGASPAIKKHGIKGAPCYKFGPGISICEPDREEPFNLHPVREFGEEWLRSRLVSVAVPVL